MTQARMIEDLERAGFLSLEPEGDVIHGRLWASSIEFTATPEGDLWRLAVAWPVRARDDQLAEWNALYPQAPLDIHLGETRLSQLVEENHHQALTRWASLAENAVAQMIRWRRAQRAPGEGY